LRLRDAQSERPSQGSDQQIPSSAPRNRTAHPVSTPRYRRPSPSRALPATTCMRPFGCKSPSFRRIFTCF